MSQDPQSNSDVGSVVVDAAGRLVALKVQATATVPLEPRPLPGTEVEIGHGGDARMGGPEEIGAMRDANAGGTLEEIDIAIDLSEPDFVFSTRAVDTPEVTETSEAAEDAPTASAPAPQADDALTQDVPEPALPWEVDRILVGRERVSPDADLLDRATGGRRGGEEIVGTTGADTLTGTAGDDILIALRGDDAMAGGAGADIFVFVQSATGHDVIDDFEAGADRIYFGPETVFDLAELGIRQDGADTLVTWHRGHSEVVLRDTDADMLGTDTFILEAL